MRGIEEENLIPVNLVKTELANQWLAPFHAMAEKIRGDAEFVKKYRSEVVLLSTSVLISLMMLGVGQEPEVVFANGPTFTPTPTATTEKEERIRIIVVTTTPTNTPEPTATPTFTPIPTVTPTPTITPNAFATQVKDVVDSVRSFRDLKDELDEAFDGRGKESTSQPQPVPWPVVVPPQPPSIIYVQPPQQQSSPDSTDAGIKAAMAIETITAGRLNEIGSATARAGTPIPVSTPRPLQVEFPTRVPVDVRITDERGMPWWQVVLLTLGGVGIAAGIFARRHIVTFVHEHTRPPAGGGIGHGP